jgi:hypothetical protein
MCFPGIRNLLFRNLLHHENNAPRFWRRESDLDEANYLKFLNTHDNYYISSDRITRLVTVNPELHRLEPAPELC